MNYFSLFNMPETFDIDLLLLKKHYQTLQKMTHPDKFASASERDKRLVLQKNSQVNDGYSVLSKSLSRAEHMLSLRGLDIDHEQQTMSDTDFLMQQMEWREHLAEIDTDEKALDDMQQDVAALIKQQESHLKSLLDVPCDENNRAAADDIRKLKFMHKLASEIDHKLDLLDS